MKYAMFYSKSNFEAQNFFAILLFMMSAFAFSSCQDIEDTNQSMALSGEWRGDFGMYYNYVDHRGRTSER